MQNNFESGRVSADLRRLLNQIERYLRLEAVDKSTVMLTSVIVAAICFALATSAIFFLSSGIVKALTLLTGNEMLSFFIVGGVLLVMVPIVYVARKPLVENKVVSSLSRSFLEGESVTDMLSTRGGETEDLRSLAEALAEELSNEKEKGGLR